MTLTADRVHAALAPRPIRFYDRVDSTNDIALDWLRQGAKAGSAVIANEQVKGRGRLGRVWYTPPGTALIISAILRPTVRQMPQLTMLGALVICELLEHLGAADVSIKWPNDAQLLGRKVSGILPEVVWNGSEIRGAVLGMGVNVRVDFAGTELADKAISIEPVLGKSLDRLALLAYLLGRVDYWTGKLGTSLLFHAWRRRLATPGQVVTVTGEQGTVHGTALDVEESGALLVKDAGGIIHRVIAGDIALGS